MVKMGAREFVYPNFGYRSRWLRNRDPVYERSEQPDARDDDVTASADEHLLAVERLQDGDHFAHRQPTQTVQRDEVEPYDGDLLHHGNVSVHVTHVGRRVGACTCIRRRGPRT